MFTDKHVVISYDRDPMGMKGVAFGTNAKGERDGGDRLELLPRDLAKLGYLEESQLISFLSRQYGVPSLCMMRQLPSGAFSAWRSSSG